MKSAEELGAAIAAEREEAMRAAAELRARAADLQAQNEALAAEVSAFKAAAEAAGAASDAAATASGAAVPMAASGDGTASGGPEAAATSGPTPPLKPVRVASVVEAFERKGGIRALQLQLEALQEELSEAKTGVRTAENRAAAAEVRAHWSSDISGRALKGPQIGFKGLRWGFVGGNLSSPGHQRSTSGNSAGNIDENPLAI